MNTHTDQQALFSLLQNSLSSSISTAKSCMMLSFDTHRTQEDLESLGRIKRLKCSYPGCEMRFTYPSLLQRHETTHEKQRPFVCNFEGCNKAFKRADVLRNHIRLHTKETPFVCPKQGCESSFANKAALKYHIAKHGCQEIYKCRIPRCKKSYSTMENLRKHEAKCLMSLEKEMNQTTELMDAKIYSDDPRFLNPESKTSNSEFEFDKLPAPQDRNLTNPNELDFISYSNKLAETEFIDPSMDRCEKKLNDLDSFYNMNEMGSEWKYEAYNDNLGYFDYPNSEYLN